MILDYFHINHKVTCKFFKAITLRGVCRFRKYNKAQSLLNTIISIVRILDWKLNKERVPLRVCEGIKELRN